MGPGFRLWTLGAALAVGAVVSGPAAAQGYCETLKKILANGRTDFASLRVGKAQYGILYDVSLLLPGTQKCSATPPGRGSYPTPASYDCKYPAPAGGLKPQHARMIAQTSACFGHRYQAERWDSPDMAIMRIDEVQGRMSVNKDGRSGARLGTILVKAHDRENSVYITIHGKQAK